MYNFVFEAIVLKICLTYLCVCSVPRTSPSFFPLLWTHTPTPRVARIARTTRRRRCVSRVSYKALHLESIDEDEESFYLERAKRRRMLCTHKTNVNGLTMFSLKLEKQMDDDLLEVAGGICVLH